MFFEFQGRPQNGGFAVRHPKRKLKNVGMLSSNFFLGISPLGVFKTFMAKAICLGRSVLHFNHPKGLIVEFLPIALIRV